MRLYGRTVGPRDAILELHRALADETRLRIVYLLLRHGELCVCEVQAILETTQSKTSRHLNHLKQAGIVEDRRDGTWVYYRLSPEPDPVLQAALAALGEALDEDPVAQGDRDRAATVDRLGCAPAMAAEPRSTQ